MINTFLVCEHTKESDVYYIFLITRITNVFYTIPADPNQKERWTARLNGEPTYSSNCIEVCRTEEEADQVINHLAREIFKLI